PADAEIDHAHLGRQRAPRQPLGDLDPEGVVAQENIPDPGDEDARPRHGPSGRAARSNDTLSSSFNLIAPARAVTGLMRYSDSRSGDSPRRRTPSSKICNSASTWCSRVTPCSDRGP